MISGELSYTLNFSGIMAFRGSRRFTGLIVKLFIAAGIAGGLSIKRQIMSIIDMRMDNLVYGGLADFIAAPRFYSRENVIGIEI